MGTGPYVEEEAEGDWTIPSSSMANLLTRTKDYYRDYDPYTLVDSILSASLTLAR